MQVILKSGMLIKSTHDAIGWDILAAQYTTVRPGELVRIKTGVVTEMRDCYAEIREKSGLACKGVQILGGIIDADYLKEWEVIMYYPLISMPQEPLVFGAGDKIAQVLFKPKVDIAKVGDGFIVRDTKREGGFGSTGKS